MVNKIIACGHCGKTAFYYRQYSANGAVTIVAHCNHCQRNATPGTAFHKKSDHPDFETYEILSDYREQSEPCAVSGCQNRDTEYHHFAPRHLFGEHADSYPGAYLCKEHHKNWHDIVTPNMSKRR